MELLLPPPIPARLRDRDVLDQGVLGVADDLAWDIEAFAVATGYDGQTGRYLGLAVPHQDLIGQITDRTLLVHPDLALLQREEETAERAAAASVPGAAGTQPADRHGDEVPGDGVELEIRVEIAAQKPDGYPDDKVRNVTENARTLKFKSYGFEDR